MLQNLQSELNDAKFQKFQLDNLVDFEKCCKTRIYLQRSAPIQPKTSEVLPKFCQKVATTLRPPEPSEYEEAVKLARKGKTVRWAASEVEV